MNSPVGKIVTVGVFAVLIGHAAIASANVVGYTDITGWTEDSRFLVYEQGIEYAESLRRDRNPVTKYVLSGRSGSQLVMNAADYATWVQDHPVPEAPWTTRLSPPQTPRVPRVAAEVIAGQGKWNRSEIEDYFAGWEIEDWDGKPIHCRLKREKTIIDSHTFTAPKNVWRLKISMVWSPNGQRIAWFMRGYFEMPASGQKNAGLEHVSEVFIDRAWGPRIQIASKGFAPETIDKITTAIEKAGFAPTGEKEAIRQRSKSVVYARKGFQDDAKKIAAVIPGGATIEPLKRKSIFDVVVALGQSANTR